jgi:hypothetical protein
MARPSKGPRENFFVRAPETLGIKQAAEDAGYPVLNDFVVEILQRAKDAGLWPTTEPGQEQLKLSA